MSIDDLIGYPPKGYAPLFIKCDNCTIISTNWEECEVYCEDCGDHSGLECPNCDYRVDLVFNDLTKADNKDFFEWKHR